MKASRRSSAMAFATAAFLLGGSLFVGPAHADGKAKNEETLSCRAIYVAKLRLARAAAARGDQKGVVDGLEQAQDVLRFCTDDPRAPGGAGQNQAPAHVIGRADDSGDGALAAS